MNIVLTHSLGHISKLVSMDNDDPTGKFLKNMEK
jgi:hypothetical protein